MYDFSLKGVLNDEINSVFEAFSNPQVISKWFAPGNLNVSFYTSNFEVGGQYQAVLQSPDGFQQTIVGSYHDIQENHELSFTWRWDDTNDITKVNIGFRSLPNEATHIHIKQSGFSEERAMVYQQHAWLSCLEKLSIVLKSGKYMQNLPIEKLSNDQLPSSL